MSGSQSRNEERLRLGEHSVDHSIVLPNHMGLHIPDLRRFLVRKCLRMGMSEAVIYVAMTRLITRRLASSRLFLDGIFY